jgi:hypothetical protein
MVKGIIQVTLISKLILLNNNVIVYWTLTSHIREEAKHCSPAVPNFLCVWPWSNKRYVTRNPTMEEAIVSDVHYKWTNNNAFSWTLHNIATY